MNQMTVSLYPLKFHPRFKVKPWGGRKLETLLGKPIPPHEKIGESWEIADRGKDSTPVANGEYAGQTLHSLIKVLGNRLLGDGVAAGRYRRFPLLYKILDVDALISLQVHPPDGYARQHEGDLGKVEMWYVLQADPGTSIIAGLREGVDCKRFEELLGQKHVEKAVRQVEVKAGDAVFIPPGRLHSISPSCLMVEIQENSDVTYRVYDWGRMGVDGRPRPLHLKQAMDVVNFDDRESPLIQPLKEKSGENEVQLLADCPAFTVELLRLKEDYRDSCRGRSFQVLIGLEGEGTIETGGHRTSLSPGEFVLLPAYLGPYTITPRDNLKILKSYVS